MKLSGSLRRSSLLCVLSPVIPLYPFFLVVAEPMESGTGSIIGAVRSRAEARAGRPLVQAAQGRYWERASSVSAVPPP